MNKKLYNLILGLNSLIFFYSIIACSGNKQSKISTEGIMEKEIEAQVATLPSYDSPDLAFHDLYGKVKYCLFIDYGSDSFDNTTKFLFDQNGEWTNIPDFEDYEKSWWPELNKHKPYEKNNEGYITKQWLTTDLYGPEETIWEWQNGRPSKRLGEGYFYSLSYNYDDNGLLTSKKIKYGESEGIDFDFVLYSYSDHQFDDHNNWIKRKVTKSKQVIGDAMGDNTLTEDTYYEEREITYYN